MTTTAIVQDTTIIGRFANEAGCDATCHWAARYSIIHSGWQIRHSDGEAVRLSDIDGPPFRVPEDVQRWLKTLHPK